MLRDQLDRFGEIDTTAQLLAKVAARTTGHVVLNRDDPRLVALAAGLAAEVSYFGVAPALREQFPTDEEMSGGEVAISELKAAVELVALDLGASTELTLRIGDAEQAITLHAEGAHNAQNAAGAAALALTLGMDAAAIAAGLRAVQPAFGRGQSFDLAGRRVVLQLVKNPAGFRQSLRTVTGLRPAATVIAINDDYADGRDMSWLWDVEFASVLQGDAGRLVTSGTGRPTWRCGCTTTAWRSSGSTPTSAAPSSRPLPRSRRGTPSWCSPPTPRCGSCTRCWPS